MTALIMTPERAEIRNAIRDVVGGTAAARAVVDGDDHRRVDDALAEALGVEFGLAGLVVSEQDGGSGGEFADLAVVFEELGRSLAPVGLFSTIAYATPLLRLIDTSFAHDLLTRIAAGSTRVAVVHAESATFDEATPGAEMVVTAKALGVIDAVTADVLLAVVPSGNHVAVVAIDVTVQGVQVESMNAMDSTRNFARVELNAAVGEVLGMDDGTAAAVAEDVAIALLAGDQVGGMAEVLERVTEYVKLREQFGRPIGSFQAIQHALVDLTLELESARAAYLAAIDTVDGYFADPGRVAQETLHLSAALAGAAASESYRTVSDEALHLNGGIGFTWEHDSHLFFRRAMTDDALFGSSERMLERVAEAAGL